MPSDDRSEIWHIVIHHTEHYDRNAILAFAIQNHINMVVQEAADKEVKRLHYHLALNGDSRSREQIKTMIKRSFPLLNGKKDYTTHLPKEEEGEDWHGLLRYLSKGKGPDWDSQGPDVVFNLGEYIDVKKYHSDFWQIQNEWKDQKSKEAKEKSKKELKARDEIVKQVVAQMKDNEDHNLNAVIKATFKAYKGACDTRQLFVTSQMVMFRLDETFTTQLICSKVYNMFF